MGASQSVCDAAPPAEGVRVADALHDEAADGVGGEHAGLGPDAGSAEPAAGAGAAGAEAPPPAAEEQPPEEEPAPEQPTPRRTVALRTAPVDPRFPSVNQARYCFVAYCEYHRCVAERGGGAPECAPCARAFRSVCPDEWVQRWDEARANGTWFGRY